MSSRKRRRRTRKLLADAALSLGLLAMAPTLIPIIVDSVAELTGGMVASYVTDVMVGSQP